MNNTYHLQLTVGSQSYEADLSRTDRPELISLVIAGRGYAVTGNDTVSSFVHERLSKLTSTDFENVESFRAVLLEGTGEVQKIQKVAMEQIGTEAAFSKLEPSFEKGRRLDESTLQIDDGVELEAPLLKEINRLLEDHFDLSKHPISSIKYAADPERRNRVLRIELRDKDQRIIFKESQPVLAQPGETANEQEIRDSFNRFSKDLVGLNFANSVQGNQPICPKCYGGSKEFRFMLQEDLGKNPITMEDRLKGNSPSIASETLERYMLCLGRFHGAGHKNVDRFLKMLRSVNPEASLLSIDAQIEESLSYLEKNLKMLDLPFPDGLKEEIETIVTSTLDPKGTFSTVTHVDPAPDNVFDLSEGLVLIDFEMASVESALLDATYARMSMPTAGFAGVIPDHVLDRVESKYRDAIKQMIPKAKDDSSYFKAYSQACAMHLLRQDMAYFERVFEKDDSSWGGVSVRGRVLTHLATFIHISEKHNCLPILRSTAVNILTALAEKWEGARPLGLYPVFLADSLNNKIRED